MTSQNTKVTYKAVSNFTDLHKDIDSLLAKIEALKAAEKDLAKVQNKRERPGTSSGRSSATSKSAAANENRRIRRLDQQQRTAEAAEKRIEKGKTQAQQRRHKKATQLLAAQDLQHKKDARAEKSLSQAQDRRNRKANQQLKEGTAESNRRIRAEDSAQKRRDRNAQVADDVRNAKSKARARQEIKLAEARQKAKIADDEAAAKELHAADLAWTKRIERSKDEAQRARFVKEKQQATELAKVDKQLAIQLERDILRARQELMRANQTAMDGNNFTRDKVQTKSVGQVRVDFDADRDRNYYEAMARARKEELDQVRAAVTEIDREVESRGRLYNILSKLPAAARRAEDGSSKSFRKSGREINAATALLKNFRKNLDALGKWRPRLIPPFIALIPIIGGILGLMNPLIAGMGALSGVVIGLAGSIGSLAGAAIGAIPALSALLAVGAALKMSFGGVGKALQAANKAAAGGAGSGGSEGSAPSKAELTQVEQIERAQERYRRTIEDVRDAQEGLDEAKKKYNERLAETAKRLEDVRKSEARLKANAQLAQENYWNVMADPGSTKGEKMDALVKVDESKDELEALKKESSELKAELADLKKTGVAGDKAVRDASRRLTDALWAQRDAQLDLQNAIAGTDKAASAATSGGGGVDAFQEAMDKLSPSARSVVLSLLAMQGAWDEVKKSVQESYFSNLVDDINLLTKLFPVLEELLGKTANALGKVASRSLKLVTSDEWLKDIAGSAEITVPMVENIGDGLLSILNIFKDLTMAAGPFSVAMSEGFAEGAKNFEVMVAGARESGSLAEWLETVAARMSQWWTIVKNVGKTIFNYSAAASEFGQWLTDGLEKMTENWLKASEAARAEDSPFKLWLEDTKVILSEMKELVGTFFGWLATESADKDNIEAFAKILDTITSELGPALGRIFDVMADTGVGQTLLDTIVTIVETLATFLENGGAEGIKTFFETIGGIFEWLGRVVEDADPKVIEGIATSLGIIAALQFTGVFKLLGWLGGIAALWPTLKPLFKGLKGLKGLKGVGGGGGGAVVGGADGKKGKAGKGKAGKGIGKFLPLLGGAGGAAVTGAMIGIPLFLEQFPDFGKARSGGGKGMPITQAPLSGSFDIFKKLKDSPVGAALSASALLALPEWMRPSGTGSTPTGRSGAGGGAGPMRGAGAPSAPIDPANFKDLKPAESIWSKLFGTPAAWITEQTAKLPEVLTTVGLTIGGAVDGVASGVKTAWEGVGTALTWVNDNVIQPVWTAIETALTWVNDNVIQPVFTAISTGFAEVGNFFEDIYVNYIEPVFSSIGKTMTWLKDNVVDPVWNGIRRTISSVWENGIKPVIDTLVRVIKTDPKKAFEAARDAIGEAWAGIKDLAKAPVVFVIDTVINGLIGTINKILPKALQIPEVAKPKGFHDGGHTGTGNTRDVAGVVHGDEHVIRATSRRKIEMSNPGLLDHMNTYGEVPGYRVGGLVNPLPMGSYSVTQPYHSGHNGIDLGAAMGTRIYAAADGVVQQASMVPIGGNEVYIQHDNGLGTRYSHLSRFSSRPGQRVRAGNVIGYVGSTGMSTGPHLHYMVHAPGQGPGNYGSHRNPAPYMGLPGSDLGEPDGAAGILASLGTKVTSWMKKAPGVQPWLGVAATLAGDAASRMAKAFNPFAGMDDPDAKLYDNGGVLPHGGLGVNLSGKPEAILTNEQWANMSKIQGLLTDAFSGVGRTNFGSSYSGFDGRSLTPGARTTNTDNSITIEKVEVNNPVGETFAGKPGKHNSRYYLREGIITMTNSTETFWSIDGVSLQTYAYNIETWGGDSQSPPLLRGDDTIIPYVVGDQYHRKVPASRTVSFGMWVVGANPDGTLPSGGSSRRLFEENWRALRKLIWNPNRQVNLTKRFRDWETGEIVEATAKAEFAGGLMPTMNGTQRAVFTVQFKLADPFFYGAEETISINAMQEVARNYATNPTPRRTAWGYNSILPAGMSPEEVAKTHLPAVDGTSAVQVSYLNQPTVKDGGISFGGEDTRSIAVVPGESRKYSTKFNSYRGGVYQVRVRFTDDLLNDVSTTVIVPRLAAAENKWVQTTQVSVETPAGAAFAVLEVAEHPTEGRIPKSSAINRVTNPNFSAEGGYRDIATNLYPFSSFSGTSSYQSQYRNIFANSALERASTAQKVIYNLLTNPKFGNGPKGWFPKSGAVRPGLTLSVGTGGPVNGVRLVVNNEYNTTEGPVTVSTSYAGSSVSGESQDKYGTTDGVAKLGMGKYYGSGWVYSPDMSQSVQIQLVEKRSNGTVVQTVAVTKTVTTAWQRMTVEAEKKETGTTMHLAFRCTSTKRTYISGCMLTNSNMFAGYFDGDGYQQVATGRTDFSAVPAPNGAKWSKSKNASYSTITMPTPHGMNIPAEITGYVTSARRTIAGKTITDKAMYLVRGDRTDDMTALNSGAMIYTTTAEDVGTMLTVVADAEIPDGYDATGDAALAEVNPSRSIYVEELTGAGLRAQAPATPGVHSVRAKIVPTAAGQVVRLSGGGTPYASMGWKNFTIVRGDYLGPAYNGYRKGVETTTGPWSSATPGWVGDGSPWTVSDLRNPAVGGVGVSSGLIARNTPRVRGNYYYEINRGPEATARSAAQGSIVDYRFQPGVTYTVTVYGTIPEGYDSSSDVFIAKEVAARSLFSNYLGIDVLETLPATPGRHKLRAVFTPTESGTLRLGGGGLANQSVLWDSMTILEGDLNVDPFTGYDLATDESVRYSWSGVAGGSPSVKSVASPVGVETPSGDIYRVNIGAGKSAASVGNLTGRLEDNYVTFTGAEQYFDYDYVHFNYTVMLKVRAEGLDPSSVRRMQLELEDGTVIESPQFSASGQTQIRWQFPRPSSKPVGMRLNIGSVGGRVELSEFAILTVKYDGPFFSGADTGVRWWGEPNASESQQLGDQYLMTQVFVTNDSFTGAYFDGDTPDTGTGDNTKTYAWVGEPYFSESAHSAVNLNGVDIDVKGDFYTRKIKVVATPPVASYSIVSKTADIEPQGYAYLEGVKTKVTVDVERFTVEVVGSPGDKAYAIEPTRGGYWLELAPGVNTLLLRGVGTGKLDVKYRAAWI